MGWPRVSILWLNYNSGKFLDVVLDSLRGVAELDYPDYELIAVDNGSTDGSNKAVREFVERWRGRGGRAKFIQLDRNLGFTGGNNVAFRARDKESKYVVLLNNDAVPEPGSLRTLVEYLERDGRLGACQGMVVKYDDPSVVDTAGDFLDELLRPMALFEGRRGWPLSKPIYITYADGSYSVYRVEAVRRAVGGERLFDDWAFAYFDDNVLGLRLWNAGYRVISVPVVAGRHRRSATFGWASPFQLYHAFKGKIALLRITNLRRRRLVWAFYAKVLAKHTLVPQYARLAWKAYIDGWRLGGRLAKAGAVLDIYKAPVVKLDAGDIYMALFRRASLLRVLGEERLLRLIRDGKLTYED